MVAMLQMIELRQFIEGFVFDSPAPVSTLIDDLARIGLQSLRDHPPPVAGLWLAHLFSTDHLLLNPLLLSTDHPYFATVTFAEVQVLNLPELDLPLTRLVLKLHGGFLAGAQSARLLKDFHPFLLQHHHPLPAQFLHRFQKRALNVPTVNGDRIKEAHAVNPANPTQ